jgi:hypothetical protein
MLKSFIAIAFISMTHLSTAQIPIGEQTNKHFWHTETTTVPLEVYRLWTDVSTWKDWDSGLKDATISGPFELGSIGEIISLEGRKSEFAVVEYIQDTSYTIRTKLPLGSLYVKRLLSIQDEKVSLTHEVWFSGLTGGLFAKMFGPEFRKMLPEVVQEVKRLAEK